MSTPLKVSSISVRYDRERDRILLIARGEGGELALQLTRRLAFVLISGLGKMIQQTQADPRAAGAPDVQSELLSMKHASALTEIRAAQADKTPPPTPTTLPSRLLSQIDIAATPTGRALTFSDPSGELAKISLDARQLHWFVGRLVSHAKNAGWGDPVPAPAWLEQGGSPEFASGPGPDHVVH